MFRDLVQLVSAIIVFVISMLFRLIRLMFMLVTMSISSLFIGVPRTVDRISHSWTEEATNAGVPLGYLQTLRSGTRSAVYISLVLGWLIIFALIILILRSI